MVPLFLSTLILSWLSLSRLLEDPCSLPVPVAGSVVRWAFGPLPLLTPAKAQAIPEGPRCLSINTHLHKLISCKTKRLEVQERDESSKKRSVISCKVEPWLELITTTTPCDITKLVITVRRRGNQETAASLTSVSDHSAIIVFLSSTRSRSRRPDLNRSPDEAVRAHGNCVIRARALHAPLPEIMSAASPPSAATVLCRSSSVSRHCPPPLPPANFPVRRHRPPLSLPVSVAGDSTNSAESTR
ncbi:hypothetical protein YC2023_041111 [Brassica napus]